MPTPSARSNRTPSTFTLPSFATLTHVTDRAVPTPNNITPLNFATHPTFSRFHVFTSAFGGKTGFRSPRLWMGHIAVFLFAFLFIYFLRFF